MGFVNTSCMAHALSKFALLFMLRSQLKYIVLWLYCSLRQGLTDMYSAIVMGPPLNCSTAALKLFVADASHKFQNGKEHISRKKIKG